MILLASWSPESGMLRTEHLEKRQDVACTYLAHELDIMLCLSSRLHHWSSFVYCYCIRYDV